MNKFKILTVAVAASLLASAAYAGPPQKAVDNASKAGINLLNTIMSDAGKGNGPEVVTSSVSTVNVPSSTTDVQTALLTGTPVTTSTTDTQTSKGAVTDWTRLDQGNGKVYKKYQDVTTTVTTTDTTTTPQTQVTTTTTTNFETPVTTTTYDEIDPGKSQPKNNSPEEGAPAPLVETGETVQVGAPEVETVSLELAPEVESEITGTTTTTVTETVDVCNSSAPNGCPF